MIPSDCKELLTAVASVAPKKLMAQFCDPFPHSDPRPYFVRFCVGLAFTLNFDRDDHGNSAAIIAMLDAIQCAGLGKLAFDVVLFWSKEEECYLCQKWLMPNADSPEKMREGRGATYAEAVARLFVAEFGREDA